MGDRLRRAAERWRHTPFHPQWLLGTRKAVEQELGVIASGTVLDIGCSNRWVEKHLRKECNYVGLDYPGTGRKIYGATPDVFANAAALPMMRDSVDMVVALEVLEHVCEPEAMLSEITRVLRSGGTLLLSIPFLYPVHDEPHDYQRLTIHGLHRDLGRAGLRIERIAPNLGSAETVGLTACIALAGMIREAVRRRRIALVLVPAIALLILATNLFWWISGKLLPSWGAVTAGYTLKATKP